MRANSGVAVFVALALAGTPSLAQRGVIHSDLPLYTDPASIWPRSLDDRDNIGCASRVQFGDWRLAERVGEGDDETQTWLRLTNYGVVHCAAVEHRSEDRERLADSNSRLSYFVELGPQPGTSRRRELWALQSGVVPGSDYLLLVRDAAEGAVTKFDVLQRRCRRSEARSAQLNIFSTGYCALNSQAALRGMARRMAKLAPVGRLELVDDEN